MVAFATKYAPKIEAPDAENRVWGFFLVAPETRPADRPQSRHPRREKTGLSYETASGPTNFLNRDPINEIGSMLIRDVKREGDINEERNLYAFAGNDPINSGDYLGLSLWCWLPWVDCEDDHVDDFIDGIEEIWDGGKDAIEGGIVGDCRAFNSVQAVMCRCVKNFVGSDKTDSDIDDFATCACGCASGGSLDVWMDCEDRLKEQLSEIPWEEFDELMEELK